MIRLIRPDSANIIRNIQMIAAMMKRQGLRARMNVISAAVMLLTGRRRTRTVPVRIQDQKMDKTRKIRQKTQHQAEQRQLGIQQIKPGQMKRLMQRR